MRRPVWQERLSRGGERRARRHGAQQVLRQKQLLLVLNWRWPRLGSTRGFRTAAGLQRVPVQHAGEQGRRRAEGFTHCVPPGPGLRHSLRGGS